MRLNFKWINGNDINFDKNYEIKYPANNLFNQLYKQSSRRVDRGIKMSSKFGIIGKLLRNAQVRSLKRVKAEVSGRTPGCYWQESGTISRNDGCLTGTPTSYPSGSYSK